MKSLRLDRQSIAELVESWPLVVVAIGISGWLGYMGWFDPAWRMSLVIFAGLYFGYVLRGSLGRGLAERFPNARFRGLLSVGMIVMTLGVLTRMGFPQTQGGAFDLAWLGVSFVSLLAFVIVNRRDPDVFR